MTMWLVTSIRATLMLIKICGLRRIEHALAAAAGGANLVGLVFAAGRRQISPAEGVLIAQAIRSRVGPQPRLVGLFVNEQPATIRTIVAQVGLDLVQLSGDEPVEFAEQLGLPLIKAIRMDHSPAEAAWIERSLTAPAARALQGWLRGGGSMHLEHAPPILLLVDAHVPGAYGGTGVTADWQRAAILATQRPIMLAGGLTPENVAIAITTVKPLGVDVSSGVETAGVKDPARIEAFMRAAQA